MSAVTSAHEHKLPSGTRAGALLGAVPTAEYRVLREGCGVLDRSERGKLALSGADAIEFLNGQVTNELAGLRAGEGRYAAFLTNKGKMLGDLRILAVGEGDAAPQELLLDTERVALQALFDMVDRFKVGYEVQLHKRTLQSGLLSLIGPESASVADAARLGRAEHDNVVVQLDGVGCLAVRTDAGVDLICEAADTERLKEVLLERGAASVSTEAAECVRIESGRPRFGIDIDEGTIPQEAGLNERAVSFAKGCYVGQETVARLHYRGKPNRHLRGLRLSAPALGGMEIHFGERSVGRVGSVASSPELGPIALALLRREAAPGARVSVGEAAIAAEIVELPFVVARPGSASAPASA